jgi:glycosyltransferase involved in cell wall biosynthesis
MNQPLVSIISFCKDRQKTIRRSIESVLNQTYRNIEFVVQDGASTDGTLEILQEYAERDSRIKLVSEPDAGHEEAFWKVLHRCKGEIMGTCLSDEELLPDAIEKAVQIFADNPRLGAITGGGYVTDEDGNITGEFPAGEYNLVDYLISNYCPFWPGSFFRTKALTDIGLSRPGWNLDCIEFEIWCRLGTDHIVKYVPQLFSKYGVHPGQLSNTPRNMRQHLDARLAIIDKMFSNVGFFGPNEIQKTACKINQLTMFAAHAAAYKLTKEKRDFERRLRDIGRKGGRRLLWNDTVPYAIESTVKLRATYFWAVIAHHISPKIRQKLPRDLKVRVRQSFVAAILQISLIPYDVLQTFHKLLFRETSADNGRDPKARAKFYLEVAAIYEARGQIQQALDMWKAAEVLRDATVEGLACQAELKLPSATELDIFESQRRWAARHAVPGTTTSGFNFKTSEPRRKIQVGYHCSFFDSDCIRAMMQGAIEKRDTKKFSAYGYSSVPTPADIKNVYDGFHDTALMSDRDFINLVRRDEIDIFVELSGFSPGNRFAAMADRCAPVQVSYLNHTATSGVANVDYVLSDDICTPAGEDRYFTEKLYRLPGCFFCFDYDKLPAPAVAPPPSIARGYVTFGCFGSGGKINEELISYWAALLRRVPRSTFYLKNAQLNSSENRRFMMDQFRRFGIGADRLRIEGGTDRQSLLKCYADVDVTLDTWPYGGGNTIGESFWQGVPVVTLYGSRFSSRYGSSLVTAAGCANLVAKSPSEYIEKAAALACDTDRLRELRGNLRKMYKQHGLGDSGRFARTLEDAFAAMMEHYLSSQASPGWRQKVARA